MTRRYRLVVLACVVPATLLLAVLAANAGQGQFYVLDGFGGVHAGGGAPAISPSTPYFGFDIARGIAYVPRGDAGGAGDGVLVLDGFGGVHDGGALASAPVMPKTPYFGFDIARAIVARNVPPRVVGVSPETTGDIADNSATVYSLVSTSIFAPDDGFLVVLGSVNLSCYGLEGDAFARTGVNVDSTSYPSSFANYSTTLRDCVGATLEPVREVVTVQRTFPVSAGMHTAHILLQFTSRFGASLRWDSPHLSVIFIDQDFEGDSAPVTAPSAAR